MKTIYISRAVRDRRSIELADVKGYRIDQPVWMQYFHAKRIRLYHLTGNASVLYLFINDVSGVEKQLSEMGIVSV